MWFNSATADVFYSFSFLLRAQEIHTGLHPRGLQLHLAALKGLLRLKAPIRTRLLLCGGSHWLEEDPLFQIQLNLLNLWKANEIDSKDENLTIGLLWMIIYYMNIFLKY